MLPPSGITSSSKGLSYALKATNIEWFLDLIDFVPTTPVTNTQDTIEYSPQPVGILKAHHAEGWLEGEEPCLRCTFMFIRSIKSWWQIWGEGNDRSSRCRNSMCLSFLSVLSASISCLYWPGSTIQSHHMNKVRYKCRQLAAPRPRVMLLLILDLSCSI